MKSILALTLALAMVSLGVPSVSFAAGRQARQGGGQLVGTARSDAGNPIANGTVRLRDTANGEVISTTRTAANGDFSFGSVPAGDYVVELVDSNGIVIATSSSVSLAAGAMSVTGVPLTVAVAKTATGSAGAAGATGAGHFFTSTGGIVLLAALGGGAVAGVVAATRTTSPSK
jgi:hypothetical protein